MATALLVRGLTLTLTPDSVLQQLRQLTVQCRGQIRASVYTYYKYVTKNIKNRQRVGKQGRDNTIKQFCKQSPYIDPFSHYMLCIIMFTILDFERFFLHYQVAAALLIAGLTLTLAPDTWADSVFIHPLTLKPNLIQRLPV